MNTNFLAKQITAIFNVQAQASSLWGLLKSQCQSANGAVGWWTHYKKPLKQKVSTISSNNITPRIRVYVYMTPTATAPSQKIKRLEECIPFSRWLIYTSFTDFTNNQVLILHIHYQGCINRGTCSHPELTHDCVLTSAYVIIFWTVARNAVNKSVWRKKTVLDFPSTNMQWISLLKH